MQQLKQYHPIFRKIFLECIKRPPNKDNLLYVYFIRFGEHKGYSRYTDPDHLIGTDIPAIPEYKNISLEEAIEDSVKQLEEFAKDKNIYLICSGGIDSTLAFYALLESNIQFNLIVNADFEEEYALLKQQLENKIIPNIDVYYCNEKPVKEFAKDSNNVFVTGEIGDQIIGSMITMKFPYQIRTMSLIQAIKKDVFRALLPERLSNININYTKLVINYFSDVLPFLLNLNQKNPTVAEFLWALNFIYKYLLVLYRSNLVGLTPYGLGKNCYHFFNTEKFQQYAMSHYVENCAYKEDYEYKQPYKDWIYARNGDEEYRKYKLKVSGSQLNQPYRDLESLVLSHV